MDEETAYQRLKWMVLDEAGFHHNASIAYYWAKRAFPGRSIEELDPIVQRVLLDLLDEGLIFFHWGGWDDGVDLDPHTAERATRAEVEADLARGGDAEPIARTVWFSSTDAGEEKLASIPAEVLLGYEEKQEWQAFLARHPEFPERQEEWIEASTRWVREGGRRPKPSSMDYDDYPGERRHWAWHDSLPGTRLGNLLGRIYMLSTRLRGKQLDL
jgi:hypothetical protein